MEFKTAREFGSDLHIKALVYGDSGSGKTYMACRARGGSKVFHLLVEANGLATIRQANPDAVVVRAKNIRDVREFMKLAKTGELRKQGCETIVVDQLGEIQQMMKDEILGNRPKFMRDDWGTLLNMMRGFLRTLRDLEYDIICLAHSAHDTDEATGARHCYPKFQGQIANEIAGYFSLVGYAFKKEEKEQKKDGTKISHKVMLDGPTRILCKPCAPVGGIEDPDIAEWFGRIRGTDKPDPKRKTKQ